MADVTYSKRESLFEKGERSWTVSRRGLDIADGHGQVLHIDFPDITGVRLAFAPTRYKAWRYVVVVSVKGGARFEIDNGHFTGVADFENRSATFRPMVEALLDGIRAINGRFKVQIGAVSAAYWLQLGLVFGAYALLVAVIVLIGDAWPWPAVAKGVVLLVSLPLLLAWIRRARPRTVPISALPQDALPPV
ncbi:MAG: hypothetical protein JF615_01230 [Asticcacaulis sp.]|nr:hypothetical protein [Asticcacaulis sp.]